MPVHLTNEFSGQQGSLSAIGTQGNLWPLGAFTKDLVLVKSQRTHPGMPRNVMTLGLRSNPMESQYIHCLQQGGGVALISNTTTHDLLYQKVMAAHGLLGLSRLSNRKDVKVILPFETNIKSLEESPAFPSTTGCRSPQERPSVHSQRSEWSALNICTHFPFIGSMTSHSHTTSEHSGLNGGKDSDWLRPESTA